ncbi:hypothetical protein PIROE2DRAFT_15335 [Piromyces sp. E2]|nr:hypothetical protein PIROE2DRAFT_15335 [Piromyces sp. E2]|eukprot:OUM59196.1 hypothetical protein PIROE2DRAFT_15335 [Piromyces sp. E2]
MELIYLLLLICCFNYIYADITDVFNFEDLEPVIPSFEFNKYNATNTPKIDHIFYLNDEGNYIPDYENFINEYMNEYYPNIEYEIIDITEIELGRTKNVHMIQTYKNIDISNSGSQTQ